MKHVEETSTSANAHVFTNRFFNILKLKSNFPKPVLLTGFLFAAFVVFATPALASHCNVQSKANGYFFDNFETAEYVNGFLTLHFKLKTPYNDGRPWTRNTSFLSDECANGTTQSFGGRISITPGTKLFSIRFTSPTHFEIWNDETNTKETCANCSQDFTPFPGYYEIIISGFIDGGASAFNSSSYRISNNALGPPVMNSTLPTPQGCATVQANGYFFDNYERAEYINGLLTYHFRFKSTYNDGRAWYSGLRLHDGLCQAKSMTKSLGVQNTKLTPYSRYYSIRFSTPTYYDIWNDETNQKENCLSCSVDIPTVLPDGSPYTYISFAGIIDPGYNTFLDSTPFPIQNKQQATCIQNCFSNVLFLPGLEASRLYRPDYNGGMDQLWEPNANSDVEELFLNKEGKSIRSDIYTKDVIDEKNVLPLGQGNIYKSFIDQIDGLKTAKAIADYGIAPYDWRLSLDDILSYGSQLPDGRLYYSGDLAATSSPFIIQELKRLATNSKTKKVTIVAHSNGGLVAKTLMQKLGETEAAKLIDKIIFVAVPQTGTPQALGALLHGFDQGLPFDSAPFILNLQTARTLAEDMPSAYNLLPSEKYFSDTQTPVATFGNFSVLSDAFARYGTLLNTPAELHSFLLGEEGRAKPAQNDLDTPNVLNGGLLGKAEIVKRNLDSWTPPAGIEVIQIAGWGIDTLESLEYYQKGNLLGNNYGWGYNPKLIEDGDGTVVVPSALAMSTSTPNVKRYWVDLNGYKDGHINRKHADILEVPELRTFIQNIITKKQDPLPTYVSDSTPTLLNSKKKLRFFLHSPLTLNLYDDQGRHTGISTTTGMVDREIPGTDYREFGEVKYISTTASTTRLEMNGLATGTFTLNVEEISGGQVATSTTFVDIPVAASTIVTMDLSSPSISDISNLRIDSDGDGTIDFQLKPGSIVSDTTAPTTVAPTTGNLGKNDWYTSDVTVALSAQDNESGAGVKTTEYSLDNGITWNIYSTSSPITLSTEGIYTLLYSSTDFFNNKENVASTTIKIDKTAPEATVTFDPLTQKLRVVGKDNLSTTTASTVATSTIITDEAGNTLEIIFSKLKQEKKEIKAEIHELRYNGVSTGKIPKTVLQYEWSLDKTGKIKELEEKATVDKAKTEGHYDIKKNVTRIKKKTEKESGGKEIKETLTGLVVINIRTNNGGVSVNY